MFSGSSVKFSLEMKVFLILHYYAIVNIIIQYYIITFYICFKWFQNDNIIFDHNHFWDILSSRIVCCERLKVDVGSLT